MTKKCRKCIVEKWLIHLYEDFRAIGYVTMRYMYMIVFIKENSKLGLELLVCVVKLWLDEIYRFRIQNVIDPIEISCVISYFSEGECILIMRLRFNLFSPVFFRKTVFF